MNMVAEVVKKAVDLAAEAAGTLVEDFVLIQILSCKWLMELKRKLKKYNLVIKLKVVRLQVYFNLKHLMRYMITKVLLLQVVTMLKKMVDLSWFNGSVCRRCGGIKTQCHAKIFGSLDVYFEEAF